MTWFQNHCKTNQKFYVRHTSTKLRLSDKKIYLISRPSVAAKYFKRNVKEWLKKK